MKIKMLLAAMLLMGGAASGLAQVENCNKNSSISHEAVKAGNFKDAYDPCMAVLKDCPTLRYYTFTDAQKILIGFLGSTKDRNSADYKRYFDELMNVYDLRMKYIPEFAAKGMKGVPSVASALGDKAVSYMQYAPAPDLNQAYAWLKEAVDTDKGNAKGATLNAFMETTLKMVQADKNLAGQFLDDYQKAKTYVGEAIATETKPNVKEYLQTLDANFTAMLVQSGVADCDALQEIYGPQVEEHKADSAFLNKAITVLKLMNCKESEVYFKASEYSYQIDPTPDAAVGVAYMYYKKADYDNAVKFFNEALDKESDSAKKAEMACATAAALMSAKKLSQAKTYCYKAMSYKEDFGQPYIILAQLYGSNPRWSDEPALNKCTYFVVIDKLQRAKSIDPSCAEQANELISTYSRYTPQAKDLFMLGYKAGDRITIEGWIGESTTIR